MIVRSVYELAPYWTRLAVRVGLLVAALNVLERLLLRATRLPSQSYEQSVLVAEVVRHLLTRESVLVLGLLGGLVAGGLWKRSLGPRWEALSFGLRSRSLALVVAGILAWSLSTSNYNAYFDELHLLDRLLLLALLPFVVWRPVFIWAFLLIALPLLWQFHIPLGGASWSEPILLIRVLIVLGVAYLMRAGTHRLQGADVVFVVCCLVASHYWVSGVGKLELGGWMQQDRAYYLLPATYANGWLGFLEPEKIDALTLGLSRFNGPLKVFTLLVECGALVALARRGLLYAFLGGGIVLHSGIFLTTGIFFWKWMVLDVTLLALIALSRRDELPIFTSAHVALSIVLIGGGALWFRPVKLAWHDARVSYTYRIEAETADGVRHALPPRYFEPYAYQFTLSSFAYLSEKPRLPITWGATGHRPVADGLARATTPDAVWRLEADLGRIGFQPERAAQFDAFMLRFVEVRMERGVPTWRCYLQAPPQVWTFPYCPTLPPGADVRRLIVTQVTSLFDDAYYREIRSEPVRIVELGAKGGGRTQ